MIHLLGHPVTRQLMCSNQLFSHLGIGSSPDTTNILIDWLILNKTVPTFPQCQPYQTSTIRTPIGYPPQFSLNPIISYMAGDFFLNSSKIIIKQCFKKSKQKQQHKRTC